MYSSYVEVPEDQLLSFDNRSAQGCVSRRLCSARCAGLCQRPDTQVQSDLGKGSMLGSTRTEGSWTEQDSLISSFGMLDFGDRAADILWKRGVSRALVGAFRRVRLRRNTLKAGARTRGAGKGLNLQPLIAIEQAHACCQVASRRRRRFHFLSDPWLRFQGICCADARLPKCKCIDYACIFWS